MLKTWHGARMRQMRRWHADGNFCATQCVDCTEWAWWTPAPFGGGGTGGKAEKVKTEEREHREDVGEVKDALATTGSSGLQ